MDDILNDAHSVISLVQNLGVMTFGFEHDYEHRRAVFTDLVYYPGFKAARAWAMGRTDLLNEQEAAVLSEAERMVSQARASAQSSYDLLIRLHDLLIGRVAYTHGREEWTDVDTAVGALLNGQADCDGYADAFYLLCTLAGFEAGLQYGYAPDENGQMGLHKWNTVHWGNAWYHADVTMDDVNFDGAPSATSYPFLLMGSAMMDDHDWVRESAVFRPAEQTDWSSYYYTADSTGVTYGAYFNTMEDAAAYAAYMQRECGRESIHFMIDGIYQEGLETVNQLLIDHGMTGQWYLWGRAAGGFTFISITMLQQ